MDFEDWHSREGGRDLIENAGSVKLVEAVRVEKSTLFRSFPDPASKEVVLDAGEGFGVPAGNALGGRGASEILCCSSGCAELSGGLGRDSGRQALSFVAVFETFNHKLDRTGLPGGFDTSTSADGMIHSRDAERCSIANCTHDEQRRPTTSQTTNMQVLAGRNATHIAQTYFPRSRAHRRVKWLHANAPEETGLLPRRRSHPETHDRVRAQLRCTSGHP